MYTFMFNNHILYSIGVMSMLYIYMELEFSFVCVCVCLRGGGGKKKPRSLRYNVGIHLCSFSTRNRYTHSNLLVIF